MQTGEWSKAAYQASVSSRCWWFTPYDDGWDGCPSLARDGELREILAMEQALAPIPAWAVRVVEKAIRPVAPCGHHAFPLSYLEAVDAIGSGAPPPLLHTCFTVAPERKARMEDYALCLDAWLAGATPGATARELAAREAHGLDWHAVCAGLWGVLGERTELKELLVQRVLHQTRWWLKATVWEGDLQGARFARDHFVGDWHAGECLATYNGNPDLHAPGLCQHLPPRVRRLEDRLSQVCPDWHWFRTVIVEFSWPCAPKAFRFLEKTLWCIGRERPAISLPSFPLADPEDVPSFLQCEATYPNQEQAAAWWQAFLAALRAWWQSEAAPGEVAHDVYRRLGEPSPVKAWLARLLVRRLELLDAESGSLAKLVSPPPDSRRGTAGPSPVTGGAWADA